MLFFLFDTSQKKQYRQEETKIQKNRKECEVHVMKKFL